MKVSAEKIKCKRSNLGWFIINMVKYTRPRNSREWHENIVVVTATPSAGGVQMEGSQQGLGAAGQPPAWPRAARPRGGQLLGKCLLHLLGC